MTVLFLAAEVIAHILDRRKARRAAAAGDGLLVAGSVENDAALRELERGRRPGQRPQQRELSGRCPAASRWSSTRRPGGAGRPGRCPRSPAGCATPGAELSVVPSTDYDARPRGHGAPAVAGGADVLAVMGGDGMMHLGVNACADQAGAGPDAARPRPGRHAATTSAAASGSTPTTRWPPPASSPTGGGATWT